MGATESHLEREYLDQEFTEVNPSPIEFDLWSNLHNQLAEIEKFHSQFNSYSPLVEEKFNMNPNFDKQESINFLIQLGERSSSILKLCQFVSKISYLCYEVLHKSYDSAIIDLKFKGRNFSFEKFFDKIPEMLVAKTKEEQFPFDFYNFKASIIEILKFLVFIHDFDSLFSETPEIMNDLMTFMKLYELAPQSLQSKFSININDFREAKEIITRESPFVRLMSKQMVKGGFSETEILRQSLERLIIIYSNTLLKISNLSIQESTFLIKALSTSIKVIDEIEYKGVFADDNRNKSAYLMAIQVLAKCSATNDDSSDAALKEILSLKMNTKREHKICDLVQTIFDSVAVVSS